MKTIAADRFEAENHRRFRNSADISDTEAEAVYAYIISRIYRFTWPDCYSPPDVINQVKHHLQRGFPVLAEAFLNMFRQHPGRLNDLIDNYNLLESEDTTLLNRLPLPADHENGRYFFKILTAKKPSLTKAFIDQGAVVNKMSVYNGKVYSALSYALSSGSERNVELLRNTGATDENWFKLLVPGTDGTI